MRTLHTEADLIGPPVALREALAACMERWRTSGVPYDPAGEFLLLVEPADSIDAVCLRVGAYLNGEDKPLRGEWTTGWGPCFETYICFSDDGCGLSLVTPKLPGIDANLLALCAAYVTQQPPLT